MYFQKIYTAEQYQQLQNYTVDDNFLGPKWAHRGMKTM